MYKIWILLHSSWLEICCSCPFISWPFEAGQYITRTAAMCSWNANTHSVLSVLWCFVHDFGVVVFEGNWYLQSEPPTPSEKQGCRKMAIT